jgi:tyrosine-protein kinase Etk/Wzc
MARASSEPVFPKPKIVYLTAALMAILLSMAFVMIKDMFGNKVRFKKDIEFLTSYPIIAEIGSDTTKSMIVIGDNNRSSIAEQFRKLRTTLKHAGISATQKKILITSSIPGEGKSYVATNLSLSLALTGKKVVLVDMDLNNPSLTSKIKTGSKKGISEFLEHKAEWEEIVKRTTLHDNLFFIPTGQLPDNPSELLLNGRIEFLLEMLEETFDYIILDTAPVTPVTDAYLLSPMCDLTLFVIRHRYTPKYYVQKMKEAQHMNQLKNVAIIYNGIVSSRYDNMYGDRYSYGYYQRARQDKKRIAG